MQVVATFTQRQEASPAKYDTIDAAGSHNRSFPHLDTSSGGGAGSSSSSSSRMTRTAIATTTTSVGGGQSVGQEHMFHQQVGVCMHCVKFSYFALLAKFGVSIILERQPLKSLDNVTRVCFCVYFPAG